MIEQAFSKFGKQSFQHGIFYSNKHCLRFELSEGADYDSNISMFNAAVSRTTDVLETAFANSEKLSVCIAFAGDSFLSNMSEFKEIHQLGITFPAQRYILKEWVEDEEWNRNYIFFTIQKSELHKFLFGKLANELGIRPSFWFDLYIYDIDLGILAHPYDDRGMDLVGTNKFMLSRIYKQYSGWLLNYDIDVMRQWFGAL